MESVHPELPSGKPVRATIMHEDQEQDVQMCLLGMLANAAFPSRVASFIALKVLGKKTPNEIQNLL